MFGNSFRRDIYNFNGATNSSSKLAWSDIDIDLNLRTITPKNRTGESGIGSYNSDSMMNFTYLLGSNGRIGFEGNWLANSGVTSGVSTKQITTLTATAPNIFWDAHRFDYSRNSNEPFSNQNSNWFYNFWRIGQSGSNVVNDIAQNTSSMLVLLNHDTYHDDSLFTISGDEQSDESHGNNFNKVVVSTNSQDFSVTRPLIFTVTGGLPRQGGDVYSQAAPVDGSFQAADLDYYLNYYPKYNGSLTNISRSKSGYDWHNIAGTSGGAGYSAYRGYSAVCKEKVNVTTSN